MQNGYWAYDLLIVKLYAKQIYSMSYTHRHNLIGEKKKTNAKEHWRLNFPPKFEFLRILFSFEIASKTSFAGQMSGMIGIKNNRFPVALAPNSKFVVNMLYVFFQGISKNFRTLVGRKCFGFSFHKLTGVENMHVYLGNLIIFFASTVASEAKYETIPHWDRSVIHSSRSSIDFLGPCDCHCFIIQ